MYLGFFLFENNALSNDGYLDLSNFFKFGLIIGIISFNLSNISLLDISNHKIRRDKNIKPEAKEIYTYLFEKGFEKT